MSIFEKIENTVDLKKKLVSGEVMTEINEDEYWFSSFYRVGENKKIHKDVYGFIRSSCVSCGLVDWTRPDESADDDEFRMAYQLKLIENNWPADSIHLSIFKKLVLDAIAINGNKKIFTITDKQLFINKPDNMFPILTLKYKSFEAMLPDMISAANYIKENLDAGKNRDN